MPVIARFRDLPGAEVASATLEAAGITNSLFDANMIGVVWTDSTALAWVKVYVADADAEEAREVLEPPDEIDWPPEIAMLPQDERCPVCGSDELALESGPRKTLALMSWFPFPLWLWRSKLRCHSCGNARLVALRFRPELVLAWFLCSAAVAAAMAVLLLALAFLLSTLSEISR